MKRLTSWLNNGFLELDNSPAEISIRFIAIGRQSLLFMGSERGKAAKVTYTLNEKTKLNRIDPLVWLNDVLGHIADH